MKLRYKVVQSSVLRFCGLLSFALFAAVVTFAQVSQPAVVSSVGYINGSPLTVHTSTAFHSTGASTLVAFVSTNTPWNGLPVSIGSVTDNLGNPWSLLAGPKTFSGSSFTLLSAIYYVNGPATSATHTVTVQLSNPAPLVFHVFALSGSDVSGPPIFSAITDPGAGATSANVTTAPISVPANSLLLSWAKNETGANATAVNGYSMDNQSTSFLWAESQSPISSGSYTGDFQYSMPIGWQAAIVGLQPATGPVAQNQSVITDQDTLLGITLTATSPQGYPLTYSVVTPPTHGTLSGSAPTLTYLPDASYLGSDKFTFRANDGTTNSNVANVSITVRGSIPFPVSTTGYINGTPLTSHTSAAFNSAGASTLVAFVSSHPSWNNLPVSIAGVTDSAGNTWNRLTGPTQFPGSSFTLLSAIYYVNSPTTSSTHMVTVQLTNPAPLVFHVFAVSGSDVNGPPVFSAITDPGQGGASANVTTASITVPANSLLLSWAKNESAATATALNGYSLDDQSTSFLWAESQSAINPGSYNGQFQYSAPIGWQAAVLGLQPRGKGIPPPAISSAPATLTNQSNASFSFTDSQAGVTFVCSLDNAAFGACSSPLSYFALGEGSHTFSVKAQDSAGNQSSTSTLTWTIDTTPPPVPAITSAPANPTNQTSASFSFTDAEAGVTFICQLDNNGFSACVNPKTYSGLSQASHTFSVKAQDAAGNQSAAVTFTWSVLITTTPPTITSKPANPTNQTSASFTFADSEAGVIFFCSLDTSAFSSCSSPQTYSGLIPGNHTFSVKAQDSFGNQSSTTSFSWIIDVTPPPVPSIVSSPPKVTKQNSSSFKFSDTEAGVGYLCQLDGSGFSVCSSPKNYNKLTNGVHTFSVEAQDRAGNRSGAISFTWTIQ